MNRCKQCYSIILAIAVALVISSCSEPIDLPCTSPENERKFSDSINDADITMIRGFLADGPGANCRVFGWAPIYLAVVYDQPEVVAMLLNEGAKIDTKSGPAGRSALHEAAHRGNRNILTILVDRGADVNLYNNNGRTVLYYAERRNKRDTTEDTKYIVALLKQKGASL